MNLKFQNLFLSKKLLLLVSLLLTSRGISSSIDDYLPLDTGYSSSYFGDTGLAILPTARFQDEGTLKFGLSSFYPYEVTSIAASPFPWMEAVFRYTEIKNEKYGPASYSGNQTNKDKGFDFKFRLKKETRYLPNVALGLRDLAGEARFSSEYFAFTKSFYDLDLTMGIAWGFLGRDENISNPFKSRAGEFANTRARGESKGGFNYSQWFSGPASIFGGLEYRFSRYGVRFKLEYDTSRPDYNVVIVPTSSRLNYSFTYPFSEFLDLSIGNTKGDTFSFSFTFKGNYSKQVVPKLDRAKPVARLSKDQKAEISQDKRKFYSSLIYNLKEENIYLQGATLKDDVLDLTINQSRFRQQTLASGRAARIASALSPETIETIIVRNMNADMELNAIAFEAKELDKAFQGTIDKEDLLNSTKIYSDEQKFNKADFRPLVDFPEFRWQASPALRNHIGGPEAFYLGQLIIRADTATKLRRGLVLNASFGANIYNNFDQMDNPSYSSLPHVRSDIQEYLKEGKNNIIRMNLNYFNTPSKDIFTRLDFGILEEMYGGFGGEILYRPFDKNFGLGFTAHKVFQRDYNQRFTFRDYKIETGHLQFFYDMPKITLQVLAGKYLAGDIGATVDISRRFKNGYTLGVFATKTNVSAEEFGEGGFDKGFYFSIPLDVFFTNYQTGQITFGMHPLTRDGGALLSQFHALWGITGNSEKRALLNDWDHVLN
tara:strand:- start:4183 stop:6324 length:2142 start_codon:yes stop_codon:yes gene_type:complete